MPKVFFFSFSVLSRPRKRRKKTFRDIQRTNECVVTALPSCVGLAPRRYIMGPHALARIQVLRRLF